MHDPNPLVSISEILSRYGSLAVALAIGFTIGLQRAQANSAGEAETPAETDARARAASRSIGGIRTYPLVALAGAVAALLVPTFGWAAFCVIGFGIIVPITISYADDVRSRNQRGITTELALLLTFLIGALCTSASTLPDDRQRWFMAATLGIVITGVLSHKQPLHALAERISREDLLAWLKFTIIAIAIVPLLPNQEYGPTPELAVLNPYKIGIMVVLVAGVSLVGYGAMRWLGPSRGLSLTGLIGGLVSSTAVTLAMSHRSKAHPSVERPCALAVVLANSIMPVRVVVVMFFVNRAMAFALAPELISMALTGGAAAFVMRRRNGADTELEAAPDVVIANPFELGSALKFGALFALILIMTRFAELHLGHSGLYAAGFIAGITDLDAIALSMSQLVKAGDQVTLGVGVNVVLIAIVASMLFKATLALTLGTRRYCDHVLLAFAAMGGAALVAHFFSS